MSMHRHPLEADGICGALFNSLWKKHPQTLDSCPGVLIPDTVLYEHGFPRAWFASDPSHATPASPLLQTMHASSSSSGFNGQSASTPGKRPRSAVGRAPASPGTSSASSHVQPPVYELRKRTGKELDPRAVFSSMSRQPSTANPEQDVLAMYLEKPLETSPDAIVEYLTRPELMEVFPDPKASHTTATRKQRTGYQGIVQKMVFGPSGTVSLIQAIWSPYICMVERRINVHAPADKRFSPYERCVTHDGPEHLSKPLVCPAPMQEKVRSICDNIVRHVQAVENVTIGRMVLYFRADAQSRLYLTWCSSMRLAQDHARSTSAMGSPSHQRAQTSQGRSAPQLMNLSIPYRTPDKAGRQPPKNDSNPHEQSPSSPSVLSQGHNSKGEQRSPSQQQPLAPCPACDLQQTANTFHSVPVQTALEHYAVEQDQKRNRGRSLYVQSMRKRVGSRTTLSSQSPTNGSSSSPRSPTSPTSSPKNAFGSSPSFGSLPEEEDEMSAEARSAKLATAIKLNEERHMCVEQWDEVSYRVYSHFLYARSELSLPIPNVFKQMSLLLRGSEEPVPLLHAIATMLDKYHIKYSGNEDMWQLPYISSMTIGKWQSRLGSIGKELEELLLEREATFWGISMAEMVAKYAKKPVSQVLDEIERERKESARSERERLRREQEEEAQRSARKRRNTLTRSRSNSSFDGAPPSARSDTSQADVIPPLLRKLFPQAATLQEILEKRNAGGHPDGLSVSVCSSCFLLFTRGGASPKDSKPVAKASP